MQNFMCTEAEIGLFEHQVHIRGRGRLKLLCLVSRIRLLRVEG